MRVYGEAFFLINAWMNFLSLHLAARLARLRFRPGRALASSLLGALYAVLAWMGGAIWRGLLSVLVSSLLMSAVAFDRRLLRAWPMMLAAGLLFSGLTAWLTRHGADSWLALTVCAAMDGAVCLLASAGRVHPAARLTLRIALGNRAIALPAIRDSGNLLHDGVSGLPVIVVPAVLLAAILPQGVRPNDLTTLPPGWYLVRAKTAAGSRTLMCFHPSGLTVETGGRKFQVDAAVALSDFREKWALLPDALFEQKEEWSNASL